MKQQKVRLQDFSVDIPEIPIYSDDYNNNPDLLTAMLACHLEEIVGHELQQIPELTTIQKNEHQVLQINYGYTNHTALRFIVQMWEECEKIANLKKKIEVDPDYTRIYEAQIWQHYAVITELNDMYFEDKKAADATVVNAHVLFRSMEGRERAINAYDVGCCTRLCVGMCCCLGGFFKKKQLLQYGFLTVNEPMDPQILEWENLGISWCTKFCHRL
jgi:hypothetical protein